MPLARLIAAFGLALLLGVHAGQAAETCPPLSPAPRIAVVSAFEPEWTALQGMLRHPQSCQINGVVFLTGEIEDRPVVLFLSGVSMVNAAMTTQLALDHFNIDRLVFSGIAGGADPALNIGDVAAPEQWGEYLEASFARETPQGFLPTHFGLLPAFPNFGMIFPHGVRVLSAHRPSTTLFWFKADPDMLFTASRAAAEARLAACPKAGECLKHKPKVVVGGAGVSGGVFVDNAAFRTYAHDAFGARVLDMETAALAHVAYANEKPFIAFRSLSDLAGGGETPNQMRTFMDLASQNSAEVVRLFLRASTPPVAPSR